MEDHDSDALAVLLTVSFAHGVLQDIMPGETREVEQVREGRWKEETARRAHGK